MFRASNLFGAVAGEEAEDEDEAAEGGEGHRVAGHVDRAAVLVEAPDAGTHQDAAHEGAHGCNSGFGCSFKMLNRGVKLLILLFSSTD